MSCWISSVFVASVHNETDDQSYTQPLMYTIESASRRAWTVYAKRLIKESVVTEDDANN